MKTKKILKNKTRVNKKLFGTDGIRGTVNRFPLDRSSLHKLGFSIRKILIKSPKSRILVGTDTRKSRSFISSTIAWGQEFFHCGVIPTPGLSFLTRKHNFDFGIMITASHNPSIDNGIKIFNNKGEKISSLIEKQIENDFFKDTLPPPIPPAQFKEFDQTDYLEFLLGINKEPIQQKLVFDCANGATSSIIGKLITKLNLNASIIHNHPDGYNINQNCGSEYPQSLRERVLTEKADLGIGFDGDGDRVIMIDTAGNLINGDYIVNILADGLLLNPEYKREIVGTLMSNLGFEKALNKKSITLHRTDVGDKYIYQKLKKSNLILGAEQSGHIIHRHHQNTGDGILTFLLLLAALTKLNIKPGQIIDQFEVTPQSLVNIPIKFKKSLKSWDKLQNMINNFNIQYSHNSRILLRYSGTELLIRIMIESFDKNVITDNMDKFKKYIIREIGE
jgi:phosphoglucosamine mutase